MQIQLKQASRYFVRVSRRGPPAEPFGWEIGCEAESVEAHRSTRTFSTRIEALLDSVRTAAALESLLADSKGRRNVRRTPVRARRAASR